MRRGGALRPPTTFGRACSSSERHEPTRRHNGDEAYSRARTLPSAGASQGAVPNAERIRIKRLPRWKPVIRYARERKALLAVHTVYVPTTRSATQLFLTKFSSARNNCHVSKIRGEIDPLSWPTRCTRSGTSPPRLQARSDLGVFASTLPWSCYCRATARSERQPPRSPPFTPKESRPCSLQKLLRVPAPLALPYAATQACRTPSTVMQVSPRLLSPPSPACPICETTSRRPKVRPAATEQHRPRDKCHG